VPKEFSVLVVPPLPHNGINHQELRDRFIRAIDKFDRNKEVDEYERQCGPCGGAGGSCRFCGGSGKIRSRANRDGRWQAVRPSQAWSEHLFNTYGARPISPWHDVFRLGDVFNDPANMSPLPDYVITPEGEWLSESLPFLQHRWAELKDSYCIVMEGLE